MTGLIWFVQIVHYPLFARVDATAFPTYHQGHLQRTSLVVVPAMLLELATAVLLLLWLPAGVPRLWVAVGLGLLVLIWLSTFLLQVPQHELLARGFSERGARLLVQGNWLRTGLWSLRAVLVGAMLYRGLP